MKKQEITQKCQNIDIQSQFRKNRLTTISANAQKQRSSSSTSLKQNEDQKTKLNNNNDVIYVNIKFFDNLTKKRKVKKNNIEQNERYKKQNQQNITITQTKLFNFCYSNDFLSSKVKFHDNKQIVLFDCTTDIKLFKFDLGTNSHIFQNLRSSGQEKYDFFICCDFLKDQFQNLIVTCRVNGIIELFDYEISEVLNQFQYQTAFKVFGSKKGFFLLDINGQINFFDVRNLDRPSFVIQFNYLQEIKMIQSINIVQDQMFVETLKDTFMADLTQNKNFQKVSDFNLNPSQYTLQTLFAHSGFLILQDFSKVYYRDFYYNNTNLLIQIEENYQVLQLKQFQNKIGLLCSSKQNQFIIVINNSSQNPKPRKIHLPEGCSFSNFGFLGKDDLILAFQKTKFFIMQVVSETDQIFHNQIINEL